MLRRKIRSGGQPRRLATGPSPAKQGPDAIRACNEGQNETATWSQAAWYWVARLRTTSSNPWQASSI